MFRTPAIFALLACSTLGAQNPRSMVLAASRSGVIEMIDPATLETVSRIHFALAPLSTGLNAISASSDGSLLYVEASIPDNPTSCCALYSLDLATLQVKVAASVPGSRSRSAFVFSDGLVYAAASLTPNGIPREMGNGRLHLSPDGHWLFGVRSFAGPTLDIYDVDQGRLLRQLTPEGMEGNWWPAGVWSGGHFYLYAADGKGSGRVWSASPETSALGTGLAVAPLAPIPGCSGQPSNTMVGAAGRIFVYEQFGFKMDRRSHCAFQISGGAWALDPANGQLNHQITPDLYFSALLADPAGDTLYGLSAEAPNWELPSRLVRIDPSSGLVLKSRYLDPGFWRIAVAAVSIVPSGDVRVTP